MRQALITVSNHVAALDDPLVTAALLPPGALLHARQLRWTLCASDRCFASARAAAFFRAGKARLVCPVQLGTLTMLFPPRPTVVVRRRD
jgi:monolysocardiolipin acyltransferase